MVKVGGYHLDKTQSAYDRARQEDLESFGITFIRFQNKIVEKNVEIVLKKICRVAEDV